MQQLCAPFCYLDFWGMEYLPRLEAHTLLRTSRLQLGLITVHKPIVEPRRCFFKEAPPLPVLGGGSFLQEAFELFCVLARSELFLVSERVAISYEIK